MTKLYALLVFLLISGSLYAGVGAGVAAQDTNEVKKLNTDAYALRLNNASQTVEIGKRALALAEKLEYNRGMGEAHRVMGIGHYYLNQARRAIDNYLKAIGYFEKIGDLKGQAKVYNNIGNLYLDNNLTSALEYFQKSLFIAQRMNDQPLMGALYMNIGNVYNRKNNFYQALNYYDKSSVILTNIGDTTNLIQVLQNRGVAYYSLHQYDIAEKLLLNANKEAKQAGLSKTVASINLTLSSLYIAQGKFNEAEKFVQEGQEYAAVVADDKLTNDYNYTIYQLESKRKNFERALYYLQGIYRQDSSAHVNSESTQINIIQEQFRQQAKQKNTELLLIAQQNDRIKFWAVTVVAGLLLIVIVLLVNNVKRKTVTNTQLTELNAEVSRQKDNLDRINHHLEEIIDERTKDLQAKNKKLSEYSSYLSHQIRGPIATLRGLMNLEKEKLVDEKECIQMMDKCVSDIDQKIIEISEMLNDTNKNTY
ncbi:tetratricopeptide repeat protein [Mucilaginibacter pallidiroseus]|uniref:Tetratricopeptide repeat protein n=1 Tax=Mucilaginibacter pallidiroseus TaxID=2599295 RepID=A0A563UCF1_9SPHI|nr:tetratricopeptide repeat protein [Mucilaginibacter pallidiroseus]TWR29000.1 tetratricopeptide repeat protein [Mucilaginibacter pallidiroseus]